MNPPRPDAQIAAWLAGEQPPEPHVIAGDIALMTALLRAIDLVDAWAPADPDGALDLLEGLAEDALAHVRAAKRATLAVDDAFGPRAAALLAPRLHDHSGEAVEPSVDPRVAAVLAGEPISEAADGRWAAEAVETLAGLIDELALDPQAALAAEARWLDPLLDALEHLPDAQPAGAASAAEVRLGPAVTLGDDDAGEPPVEIPIEGPPGLPPLEWPVEPTPPRGAGRVTAIALVALAAAALVGLLVWRTQTPADAPAPIPIGGGALTPSPAPPPPDADDALPATPQRPAMLPIPAGSAWLGSPDDEPGRQPDEIRRRVTLTRPFWMARTEVTQAQWIAVFGNRPGEFYGMLGGGPLHPVEQVSWYDAVAYANALSAAEGLPECYIMSDCTGTPGDRAFTCGAVTFEGLDCDGYRLPTEAEWEYAARAGTETATYAGPFALRGERDAPVLEDIAVYSGNSGVPVGGMACGDWEGRPPGVTARGCATHPVASKRPNPWGLYDMLGNVWEWTTDGHGDLAPGDAIDPVVAPGRRMVTKGCGWFREARFCRAANRYRPKPDYRTWVLGIRVARTMAR